MASISYGITFKELTPANQLKAAELMQAIQACEAELAKLQTARAQQEALWNGKSNALNTKISELKLEIRTLRPADITETINP